MAEKTGAGGELQTYSTENGRYGSKADKLEKVESIYSDDAPRAVKVRSNKSNKSYKRLKNRIQPTVFDRISSVRKDLERDGFVTITVNDFSSQYTVRLYGADNDYDFDIIKKQPIK